MTVHYLSKTKFSLAWRLKLLQIYIKLSSGFNLIDYPQLFRKLFFIVFSSSSQAHFPAPAINGITLVHSANTKFLGNLVDNKLNFASHIRDVCAKVSRGLEVSKKTSFNNAVPLYVQAIFYFHVPIFDIKT